MVKFHALANWNNPQLHIWRIGATQENPFNLPVSGLPERDEKGFYVFPADLDHQIHGDVWFKLFSGDDWESDALNRKLPRLDEYRFPEQVWFIQGAVRVLTEDPYLKSCNKVRVHLITAQKYRGGKLYLWTPGTDGRYITASNEDQYGPYFDIELSGRDQHFFLFKFVDKDGNFEPDYANRLWSSADGAEVWVHSQADHVSNTEPVRKTLTVHLMPQGLTTNLPKLHLWQTQSDFSKDIDGIADSSGGFSFVCKEMLYTDRPYSFMFFWKSGTDGDVWENQEARREEIKLTEDREIWTFEGDHELFDKAPSADREIILEISDRSPSCHLTGPLVADVWINRSHGKLYEGLKPGEDGTWAFQTFPEVVTSFRLRSEKDSEAVERHTVKIPQADTASKHLFIVLDRAEPLPVKPIPNIFQDPSFEIERPGVWERDGKLRFAIHAPSASWIQIMGDWTGWRSNPVPMRCTRDSSYWYAEIPISDIRNDYHGAHYQFLINGIFVRQDPAADWVESSNPESASRLVNHSRYKWESADWHTMGWDYLILYQIHPMRFSQRFKEKGLSPLRQVAEEITNTAGYLRELGVTAIQLMPVNEFAGDWSWGYGPAFYYAVESAYIGHDEGPDDLKYLVDTCHKHGLAVLLDVIYNHAGTSDNILWTVARESFFDGDTRWGAMINFDHPQVIHFFEQNLRYLRREYRVDGFRFDHTDTIIRSNEGNGFIIQRGSGGGWEFLHKIRKALHEIDPQCILIAEQLPNNWGVSNFGGPMDSQWGDDFHDRIVDASRGWNVVSNLSDALKLSQTACDNWYKVVNYPESHDEVGNEDHRIASKNVAGIGQGLRRNKVAAAATLMSRGIPMWFMGAEAGEWKQFQQSGNEALDIDRYLTDENCRRLRDWWKVLCDLRRGNPKIEGPSPININYANDLVIAFSRGAGSEYFTVLNFSSWTGWKSLAEMNLPASQYRELWNSTWPAFAVEGEDRNEHSNGGRTAVISRDNWMQIPNYGVVILEKI